MAPYATIQQLELRLKKTVAPDQIQYAEQALKDASLMIDVRFPLPDNPSELDYAARELVVCNMIRRAYSVPDDAVGVGSVQQGAGPYQSTLNFVNPVGDLYIAREDRRTLGQAAQKAFGIDLATAPGLGAHVPWCSLHFGGDHCSCGVDIAGWPVHEGA